MVKFCNSNYNQKNVTISTSKKKKVAIDKMKKAGRKELVNMRSKK